VRVRERELWCVSYEFEIGVVDALIWEGTGHEGWRCGKNKVS
jgi:hypothetical protein